MMRKWLNIIAESASEKDTIKFDTWTNCQDRDGIYVVLPGSNSCYAGFSSQEGAEAFAANKGEGWRVVRHGRYKTLSDDEAMADYDIRHQRIMRGFYVPPITEEFDTDTEEEEVNYEREKRIVAAIRKFCEQEIGWTFSQSYAVVFESRYNEARIKPDAPEISLDELNKLTVIGAVSISPQNSDGLLITIKTPKGFGV